MDKSSMIEIKNRLKEYNKILKDMNIVAKARIKLGSDNKNEVLNYLKTKYGEEKGKWLVEEYWD
ncbi:MAG: hypothetical protein Q8918_02370 [Bacteroidota bacterium]|nr:hypothetical protein [Bacteroidota bacterium]